MALAERFQMQVATLNCAKGAVPESSPQFVGTYAGIASSTATRSAIEGSDCLLTVGYRRVETTVGFFTDKLPASAIHLNSDSVDTADKNWQGVYIEELLQYIVDSSAGIVAKKQAARPAQQSRFLASDAPLSQDESLPPVDVISCLPEKALSR
jgi:indolepyruvate decarboxylase